MMEQTEGRRWLMNSQKQTADEAHVFLLVVNSTLVSSSPREFKAMPL